MRKTGDSSKYSYLSWSIGTYVSTYIRIHMSISCILNLLGGASPNWLLRLPPMTSWLECDGKIVVFRRGSFLLCFRACMNRLENRTLSIESVCPQVLHRLVVVWIASTVHYVWATLRPQHPLRRLRLEVGQKPTTLEQTKGKSKSWEGILNPTKAKKYKEVLEYHQIRNQLEPLRL